MSFEIRQGDVLEVLRDAADNSFDACFCDPPYGLTADKRGVSGDASLNLKSPAGRSRITTGFMGMVWDAGVPSPDVWREILRVLKPGAFLLAFGGTRTHHRLMCAIEDAGFEIRDVMMWIYGSGFPKSLDISKAIDKQAGAERKAVRTGRPVKRMIPGADQNSAGSWIKDNGREFVPTITEAATDAAKRWDGYGTALKPAYEPIIVAMKPCDGTYAGNALAHGVAGINIDGSRIDGEKGWPVSRAYSAGTFGGNLGEGRFDSQVTANDQLGRWPANVILDEEVATMFPDAPGQLADASTNADQRKTQNTYGAMKRGSHEASAERQYTKSGSSNFSALPGARRLDSGSAARFFYCAKASAEDRSEGNNHPTVKPQDLCRYLAKLILPPEREALRRLLVPFSGSGSEMLGAIVAGWDEVVGVEREEVYIEIANRRLERHCPLLA